MSQDFEKSLVLIDELMVTEKVQFAVLKGGQSMTAQTFNAIGGVSFKNQIIYNMQLPSLEVVMSRHVLQTATLAFQISGTTVAVDADIPGSGYLFQAGGIDGFAPFPLSQLFESQTITINNTTVSQQTKSILSILCRIHDKRQLSRYNGSTPVLFDSLADYKNIAGSNLNPFASILNNSYDSDLLPRGAYPVDIVNKTAANYSVGGAATVIEVRILVTEPILVSPFVFSDITGEAGLYGVQAMTLTFNITGDLGNVVRFGGNIDQRYTVAPTVVLIGVENPSLRVLFITPHASTPLPSRNIVPFYSMDRYLSSNTPAAPAFTSGLQATSASIQLAMIPDKLYITLGRPTGGRPYTAADSWMTIDSINIQFNNQSGILSSAKKEQLWTFAVEAGSNQNWLEYAGIAQGPPTNLSATGTTKISTCGSVLMLDMVKHIALAQDWFSASSLGQFNLLYTVNFSNNTDVPYNAGDLQLMTVVQNSGVFSTQRGVSSVYQGILSKADVLEVSREEPSGLTDSLRAVGAGRVGDFFKRNLAYLGKAALKHGAPLLLEAAKKKLGMGESGGASSGGKKPRSKDMGSLEDRMY